MDPNDWKSLGRILAQSLDTESKLLAITFNTVSKVCTLSTTGINPPPSSVLSILVQLQLNKMTKNRIEIQDVIFVLNTGE